MEINLKLLKLETIENQNDRVKREILSSKNKSFSKSHNIVDSYINAVKPDF